MGQSSSRQLPKTVTKGVISRPRAPPLKPKMNPPRHQDQQHVQHVQQPVQHQAKEEKNVNATRMAHIRVEEIPLKLDQNHPALKTLRNKRVLEEALHDESSVHTVKPGTFISIVEDLNHYSLEEVKSRYGLDDEFVKILNAAKLSIPTEKVVPQKEPPKDISSQEEDILNRSSGGAEASKLESALEQLLRPK